MKRMTKAATILGVAILLAGCTTVVEGKPVASGTNPLEVGGKPVTEGPSGLRPDAPGPLRDVVNGDGGDIDRLALYAVADIEEFWKEAYGPPLKGEFTPVSALFSYDSRFKHGKFCGDGTQDDPNLAFCFRKGQNCSTAVSCSPSYNTIGWDRGVYLPRDRELFGEMMVALNLAHEYGHAIDYMAGTLDPETGDDVLVGEQRADCYSAVYLGWVANGNSTRFMLSTGEPLNKLLASQIASADPLLSEVDPELHANVHGSAFERVSAFQMGFDPDAMPRCADIDLADVQKRRGNLPPDLLQEGQTGEYPITKDSLTSLIDGLNTLFSPTNPPELQFDTPSCIDFQPAPPVAYCQSTNTITADLDRLVLMGTSLTRGSRFGTPYGSPLFGDYTAYSIVVSRYLLALQNERDNVQLDGVEAGLRTACLTGVATRRLTTEVPEIQLYGGDLDEAVTGVLTNGLIASDVNGELAPAGFARVDAFRTGVLGDEDNCYTRWP